MLTILFFLAVLVGQMSCQTGLNTIEKQEILDEHNRLRGIVNPTASNMEKMVWSDELAQVAQTYAEVCNFEHNSNRNEQQSSYQSVGENLAAGSGAANYVGFVQNWYDEVTDYDFSTNLCASGEVCGHYTQVVWATSRSLGCGAYRCSQLQGVQNGANWVIFVCNYGPAGNFEGQKPYISGLSCSDCPQDNPFCVSNLCSAENSTPENPNTMGNSTPGNQNATVNSGNSVLWGLWSMMTATFMAFLITFFF